MEIESVSLYFHIPFCSKKCPYCHFFVIDDRKDYHQPFVAALLKEWQLRLPQLKNKQIVSIYFGGGTPTKLSSFEYKKILEQIQHSVLCAPDCEITLEANPEDVTLTKMQAYKEAGINRVSLGVQSLVEEELLTLKRTHSAQSAKHAVFITAEAGIKNISIDLMFELPYQTLSTWKKSLSTLSDLPITHLSLYNLTIEPHTLFFKQQQTLNQVIANDSEKLAMLEYAIEFFETLGLKRYEISAFAKEGAHSRHNTGYWTARPFLGFGPSAFSYWNEERFSNISHYQKYLNFLERGELPIGFQEKLPYPQNLKELIAVNLRLTQGINLTSFEKKGIKIPLQILQKIDCLVEKGWLQKSNSQIALTAQGQLFYDSVAIELI